MELLGYPAKDLANLSNDDIRRTRNHYSFVKFPVHFNTGSPSAICVGSGFRGHLVEFGRNVLELLVYYLMLNKCKNLKDMKSSCLSVCTSSLYDNEGRCFLHYYV